MPSYLIIFVIIFAVIIPALERERLYRLRKLKRKGKTVMPESMLKELLGKTVTVNLFNESLAFKAVVLSYEDGWLKVEETGKKKVVRIVNCDMIRDIRIWE